MFLYSIIHITISECVWCSVNFLYCFTAVPFAVVAYWSVHRSPWFSTFHLQLKDMQGRWTGNYRGWKCICLPSQGNFSFRSRSQICLKGLSKQNSMQHLCPPASFTLTVALREKTQPFHSFEWGQSGQHDAIKYMQEHIHGGLLCNIQNF